MFSAMIALFASCVGLNLSPRVNYPIITNDVMSNNNYRVIGEVSGECSQRYIFGIGGMSDKSKESNAIREMYKNANLKPGQAIININVTYTQQIYFLAIVIKVTSIAHGTIIEFTDEPLADSIAIKEIQQAPNKSIGNPELLRGFKTAQLKVSDNDSISPLFYDQFRKQFNYRIVHYGSFSFKESEQPLIANLTITDVQGDYATGVVQFTTKNGNDLVTFYLGTGTIKALAHTLADQMQEIVK